MAELPFLVRHGWWIAKLLVIACGALGLLIVRWRGRVAERNQIKLERVARTASVGGLAPGVATLRGTMVGRAVTAIHEAGAVVGDRGEIVAVEIEGQRVTLEGRIDVARGTRAATSWRRIPALVPVDAAKGAAKGTWRATAVGDGDHVIARGTLAHASGEAGDYRDSGGAWVLSATTGTPAIDLWATQPAWVAPALHPVRMAVYVALFGLGGYLGLWGIGATLVGAGKDHRREAHALSTSLVIASALPRVRGDALEYLDDEARDGLPRTEHNVHLHVALTTLSEGCADGVRVMLREELYDEALAAARECGAVEEEIDALVHLGRYAAAAALLPRAPNAEPETIATASIGAGKWADTARASRIMIERLRNDPTDKEVDDDLVARYSCLEAYFAGKAGDADAAKRLAALAPVNETCAVVKALALPEPQRRQALVELADDSTNVSWLASKLVWPDEDSDPFMAVYDLDDVPLAVLWTGTLVWLSQFAIARRPPDARDLPAVLAQHAVFALVRGDVQGALAEVASAKQKLAADQQELADSFDRLAAVIQLHTGTAPLAYKLHDAERFEGPPIAIRNGEVPADVHLVSRDEEDQLRPALEAAIKGDGDPLAHHLECCRPAFDADAGAVLAVLPLVKQHRAELAAALRTFHTEFNGVVGLPFSQLKTASLQRDLARLAGDDEGARRWQKLIDPQLLVIADRDKVTAFLLWQD